MIWTMTIERPLPAGPTFSGDDVVVPLRRGGAAEWSVASNAGATVPTDIRSERLTQQIHLFERAGYRLETMAGMQAVVAKPRQRRVLRDLALVVATAGLYLVPLLAGPRTSYHRVAITIAPDGAVRIA